MKNKAINTVVFCLILLSNLNGIAQELGPGFEDESGNLEELDPSPAPINHYIIPMVLIGILIGYRLLKQKKLIAK
jgi:hypothetical protein